MELFGVYPVIPQKVQNIAGKKGWEWGYSTVSTGGKVIEHYVLKVPDGLTTSSINSCQSVLEVHFTKMYRNEILRLPCYCQTVVVR